MHLGCSYGIRIGCGVLGVRPYRLEVSGFRGLRFRGLGFGFQGFGLMRLSVWFRLGHVGIMWHRISVRFRSELPSLSKETE